MTFIKPNSNKIWESAPLNTKMIYYPKWREHSPNKWTTSNDFLHSTRAKVEPKDKAMNRNRRTASCKTEPYIDGLRALGERKISREAVEKDTSQWFSSVIPRDPWQKRSIYSESIRAEKALESLFENQKNNLKLVVSSRIGSPFRVTNKNLQFQTKGYKVYTTNNPATFEKKMIPNHQRSSSTGNAARISSPKERINSSGSGRKSNTARNDKIISASSKISIDYKANADNLKVKNIKIDNLKRIEKAENILDNANSTRYKVVANYDMSKNKRFNVKEDLSYVHIQQTIDYPKTYYVSALERVKKTRRGGKNTNRSGEMIDEYNMPPDPPVLSKFELMNMHHFSKFSNPEEKTDNFSGDKNMSLNDQEHRSLGSMQNQIEPDYSRTKVNYILFFKTS